MNIYKIVFMGPMGAGKTTAIKQLSVKVVSTEAENTDLATFDKATTTVGLDYGQIDLSDDISIYLYGSPGQKRFSFIWETLLKGSHAIVILLNHEEDSALTDLQEYLTFLKTKNINKPVIVAVGRHNTFRQDIGIRHYEEIISGFDLVCPIFFLDVRKKEDCLFLMESLTCQIFD